MWAKSRWTMVWMADMYQWVWFPHSEKNMILYFMGACCNLIYEMWVSTPFPSCDTLLLLASLTEESINSSWSKHDPSHSPSHFFTFRTQKIPFLCHLNFFYVTIEKVNVKVFLNLKIIILLRAMVSIVCDPISRSRSMYGTCGLTWSSITISLSMDTVSIGCDQISRSRSMYNILQCWTWRNLSQSIWTNSNSFQVN